MAVRKLNKIDDLIERAATAGARLRVAVEFAIWVALFSLFAFAFATLTPAFAETRAKIKASTESGFARLEITFDALPKYSDEVVSGVLVLTFDQKVNADLNEIPQTIPDYIGIARRDPDGRAFRLAIQRSFRVNIMEAGNKLFVDLLPPNWIGAPPPLPKHVLRALSQQALEAERNAIEAALQLEDAKDPFKVDVRIANLPTFTRVVFAWNKFVTVNMGREGRKVKLQFGRNAEANLSRLKVDPPKFLRGANAEKNDKGMMVELTIDDDVNVRGFREGNAYVVDMTGPGDANQDAAESAARAASDAVSGSENIELAGSRVEESGQAPKAPEPGQVETALTLLDEEALEGNAFADNGVALPRAPGAEPDPATVLRVEVKPEPEPAAGEQAKREPEAEPEAAKANENQPTGDGAPLLVASDEAGAVMKARIENTDSVMRLTFPFSKPVASAVFRRGTTIWLIFESDANLDLTAIEAAKGEKIKALYRVVTGSMQYVRIRLSRPWVTYVKADEGAWVVSIGDMVTGETKPLNLQRVLRDDKRSMIQIAVKGVGRVHWIKDPEVGDDFAVVTAMAPVRGVTKPQDFVDFSALESAHGIVVRPNSDDVGVRVSLDEVVITRHAGLTLSAGGVQQYVPGRKALDSTVRPGFIDFQSWYVTDPQQLLARASQLQRSIALSPDEEKISLRFTLAKLYIANGLNSESLGILNQMALVDREINSDPSFNAMRGAVLVLMGRTKEAREELEVHALANDFDAGLWRALLEAKEKNWQEALKGFDESWSAGESYPDDVQARFLLAAARAALETEQLERAAEALEGIPKRKLDGAIEAEANVLRGRYLEKIGRNAEAMEAFEAALVGPNKAAVVESEFNIITTKLKSGTITNEEAIKKLERLQIVWRGDDIELNTMRVLADLYLKVNRNAEAFSIMESAVRTFPNTKVSRQIQDDMRLVFQDLFLRGKSEDMPPIDALSLFYDHRELMPVGRLGDDMIRNLADRLIAVDLLDQASDILGHQVEKRLSGSARAQVATRLAMVHLLNRKPGLAIRALRQTRQAGLPEDLVRNRSLLEARALGELGRAEAAIEILNTLEGDEIERMKGDALWSSQQWHKAGEQIERYLGIRWQRPEPLRKRERRDVLRAAISYSLAEDQFALDRLRKKFYDKMMKTVDAESFLLVSRPSQKKTANFRQLAKDIADSDTLDAFMKEFRKNYEPKENGGGPEGGGATTDAG